MITTTIGMSLITEFSIVCYRGSVHWDDTAWDVITDADIPQLDGAGAVSYTHLDVYKRQP